MRVCGGGYSSEFYSDDPTSHPFYFDLFFLLILNIMKFFALASVLCAASAALAAPAAKTATVSYDLNYDNAKISLDAVACSDGSNGLLTKGKP